MKFKIISLLAVLFVFSCKSRVASSKIEAMETILVAEGNLYGSGSEGIDGQNLVIDNQQDWSRLITRMDSVNKVSDSFNETSIDFSKFTIIAVFDKVRGSGGYSLELKVDSNSENRVVRVTKQTPKGNASSVMTQPYTIVKIPKSDLPIEFK
jgi:hypothetical protein